VGEFFCVCRHAEQKKANLHNKHTHADSSHSHLRFLPFATRMEGAQKLDIKDFTFSNRTGETLIKLSGSIDGHVSAFFFDVSCFRFD
jgi:hypothetical protein